LATKFNANRTDGVSGKPAGPDTGFIYTINEASGCLVEIFVADANRICNFLLDTGSDITIIKSNLLDKSKIILSNSSCRITGVTPGLEKSFGLTPLTLVLNDNLQIGYNFQVVNSNFNICVDGILGRDFIKEFRCLIDYDKFCFSINTGYLKCTLPISEKIVLPARSRVIKQANLNIGQDHVLESQLIADGVMCAQAIVGKDSYVEFLNATEKGVIVENFRPKLTPLSEFEIIHDETVKNSEIFQVKNSNFIPREKRLNDVLKLDSVPIAQNELKQLCRSYQDIFLLD
jgi:Retroviral aspartyl protease